MATDATGTPTSLGIPKFNTSVDAPSGLGSNAQMDVIDTLIAARAGKPSGIVSGEVPVWNGTTWVRSSATNIGPTSLGSGTPDATKFLRGDGTWVTAAKTTTSAASGGPPGSPSDGDIWIATGVASNQRWAFQYNASGDPTYKWEFIGGSPIGGQYGTAIPGTSTWTFLGGITAPRPGVYSVNASLELQNQAGGGSTFELGLGTASAQVTTIAWQAATAASILVSMAGFYPALTYTAGQSIAVWGWGNAAPIGPNAFLSFVPIRVA